MNPQQNVVNQPKLLMSDVAYMRLVRPVRLRSKRTGKCTGGVSLCPAKQAAFTGKER